MHHLTLRFESKRHLEGSLLDEQPFSGLFHATATEIELGEQVLVTICVPQIPEGVTLQSQVVWRRRPTRWKSSLEPGVGLGFAEESAPQLEFLNQCLAGSRPPTRRSWPRWPLQLPAEISNGSGKIISCTRNVGLGGLFLHSDEQLAVGERLAVDLYPNDLKNALRFNGVVAWTCFENTDPGFGLAFPRNDQRQRHAAGLIIHGDKLTPLDPPAPNEGNTRTTQRLFQR